MSMISLYVFYSVLSIKTNKDIGKMIIKLKVYSCGYFPMKFL